VREGRGVLAPPPPLCGGGPSEIRTDHRGRCIELISPRVPAATFNIGHVLRSRIRISAVCLHAMLASVVVVVCQLPRIISRLQARFTVPFCYSYACVPVCLQAETALTLAAARGHADVIKALVAPRAPPPPPPPAPPFLSAFSALLPLDVASQSEADRLVFQRPPPDPPRVEYASSILSASVQCGNCIAPVLCVFRASPPRMPSAFARLPSLPLPPLPRALVPPRTPSLTSALPTF
jgi:hypothetical protein